MYKTNFAENTDIEVLELEQRLYHKANLHLSIKIYKMEREVKASKDKSFISYQNLVISIYRGEQELINKRQDEINNLLKLKIK